MTIRDIFHVNINCTDIERSLQFYRDYLGLSASYFEIPPELKEKNDQIARELANLPPGDVDAVFYLLHCRGREAQTAIELTENRQPKPVGVPYESVNHVGISRVMLFVDELDTLYRQMVTRGVHFLSEPVSLDYCTFELRVVFCHDPDGTLVQLVQTPYPAESPSIPTARQMPCVFINCTDLDRSQAFYEDTLGLSMTKRVYLPQSEVLAKAMGLDGEFSAEACNLQTTAGPDGTSIDLVEWKQPRACGTPYRQLWHVGIPRLAFLTDNIDEMYASCLAKGVRFLSKPRTLGSDHARTRAVHLYDPDGTVLELLEMNYTGELD